MGRLLREASPHHLRILARMHAEIGVATIREKSIRMTARLFARARERGWRVNAPEAPARRGGTVAIDVPHGERIARELLARDVVVDYRPGAGIRIAPHFYNTEEECDRALEEIADILRTRAYERHRSAAGSTPT